MKTELTPRQQQVLLLAAQGMKIEDIAKHLFLSEDTIRSHFYQMYPKLGAKNRVNAVYLAMQQGLIQ